MFAIAPPQRAMSMAGPNAAGTTEHSGKSETGYAANDMPTAHKTKKEPEP